MHNATFDLRRLIHPIEPDTFNREYWEKRPLVVRRRQPDYYGTLLSRGDVDRVLALSSVGSYQIRLLRQGSEIPPQQLARTGLTGNAVDLESLYAEYRRGATVVLQFLHERWEPLTRLCQVLGQEFSASFQVNAYLTPAREQGLNAHYDTHDVFVLQVEGSKHWRLYNRNPVRLPLPGQPYDRSVMDPGSVMQEFDLHSGDLIYLPRGCVHQAVSRGSTSLHLTVGVGTITWAALILQAIESVVERDFRLRESLPIGFARDKRLTRTAKTRLRTLLARVIDTIDPSSLVDDAAQEVLLGGQPRLERHFLDLEELPRVGLHTLLRRRPGVQFTLETERNAATLRFHGKTVHMPAHTAPDLRTISEATAEFRAADLSGGLNDEGKLVLVKSLLREGFLTISDSGSPA